VKAEFSQPLRVHPPSLSDFGSIFPENIVELEQVVSSNQVICEVTHFEKAKVENHVW